MTQRQNHLTTFFLRTYPRRQAMHDYVPFSEGAHAVEILNCRIFSRWHVLSNAAVDGTAEATAATKSGK